MDISEYFIDYHLDFLMKNDARFFDLWSSFNDCKKSFYIKLLKDIDSSVNYRDYNLNKKHDDVFKRTYKMFSVIKQQEFIFKKTKSDWKKFIHDDEIKNYALIQAKEKINSFLTDKLFSKNNYFYGGVKPDNSLKEKISRSKFNGKIGYDPLIFWDVVRFRIVCSDIMELLMVVKQFVCKFSDEIVRCRNFYVRPQHGLVSIPYRAIHFELSSDYIVFVEVQVMTQFRDAISLIDHSTIFKKKVKLENENHENLLCQISKKANIAEFLSM